MKMVKLYDMRYSLKFKDMQGYGWWYYLETGNSVIFLRVNSATTIHIELSNKQRLWKALQSNPQHRIIKMEDKELEYLVDKFSTIPETPATYGLVLGNPYENKISEKIRETLFNLYKKEYVKTHGGK